MKSISNWFMRLAVAWFLVGVLAGIGMAASHNHSMFPVHAHINLLGWVTMTLFALFYRAWPEAAASGLARIHFWVYVPAHFVMMVTLAALYAGMLAIEPVLAIASVVVGVAVALFGFIVWKYTAAGAATSHTGSGPAVRVASAG
jgi:hypothetical protein